MSAWWNAKFGCSDSSVADSASRWRLSSATTSFSSTSSRASVVAMKPAPPVTKIRLPCSMRASVVTRSVAFRLVRGKTVLFVGAGRHQQRAIERAQSLGLRVVAVDRNPAALGLALADAAEVVDFQDVDGVLEVARHHAVDGALTVSADRAVPIVAAVAEQLGLPGIGSEVAHAMTHKVAMRRLLAEAGVAQPRFAAAHDLASARAAAETVGLPAVVQPADY